MNIDQLPAFLEPFFQPFGAVLTKRQFSHFVGVAPGAGSEHPHLEACASDAAATGIDTPHPSRGIFRGSTFDAPFPLSEVVARLLKRSRPHFGETIDLILDDHRIAGRASRPP